MLAVGNLDTTLRSAPPELHRIARAASGVTSGGACAPTRANGKDQLSVANVPAGFSTHTHACMSRGHRRVDPPGAAAPIRLIPHAPTPLSE